jgi:Bifunctional DNA primase/polymerase, N-terminal/Protein of unknown function (DUF3987)
VISPLDDLPALDTALTLLSRGLWPLALWPVGAEIPTKDGQKIATGKEPIGVAWGKERPTEVSLREIFRSHPGAGVGLLLGPEGGVIDVEGDGPEAEASFDRLMGGEVVETMGWSSRRGMHRLFRWDPRLAILGKIKTTLAELPDLEIRTGLTGKQAQSACPPTPGEDGIARVWNGCETIAELPEAAIRFLENAMARPKGTPLAGTAVGGNHASDPAAAWFHKALDTEAGKVAMAMEGTRNDTLYKAAATLGGMIHHGHLTEPEIVAALTEAGRRAGLGEEEIAGTIASGLEWGKAKPLPWPEKLARPSPESNGQYHAQPKGEPEADDATPLPPAAWPAPPGQAAFHGLAGEAVRLIEEHTEADPFGILGQILVAFGNTVGRGPHLIIDGSRHGTNEFLVLVGESAVARKGTSFHRAMAFLKNADATWLKEHILNGLSSGEGLITPVTDPVWGRDSNGEPKLEIEGVTDKRLLVVESEFGSTLRVLQREGNRLSALLRISWDGGDLATMTKKPMKATEPHISVIGHITFDELKVLLSTTEIFNGLANRVLWLAVKRSRLLPFGGAHEDLTPIQSRFREALEFAQSNGRMELNREAKAEYATHYERLSTPPLGWLGSVTSRATAHLCRFAMIYALLDRSALIRVEHVRAALELVDASNRAAALIFGDSIGNPDAEKILAAIRSAPGGLTRTDISRDVFKLNKPASTIKAAMAFLKQHGMIQEVATTPASRTVFRYYANEKNEFNEINPTGKEPISSNSLNSFYVEKNGEPSLEVFEL